MKLNDFDYATPADSGFELAIIDADGNDTDFIIELVGMDGSIYKNASKTIRSAEFKAEISDEGKADELMLRVHRLISCCVRGWRGLEDSEGNNIPFTKEKAFEIFSDDRFKIDEQVNTAIHSRDSYLKKKPNS